MELEFNSLPKYVISLPEREDRKRAFSISAEQAGIKDWTWTIWKMGEYKGRIKKAQSECKWNHALLINILKTAKEPYGVIMEDDAVFDRDFIIKFNEWVKEAPDDWDMIYLGAHNHRPLRMISEHVGRCTYSLSTVGYIVRNTIYEVVIEMLKQDKILDMIYATQLQTQANCYCFKPNLVTQAAGYSDIEHRFVDYSKYYK